jgi:hypothetical protein
LTSQIPLGDRREPAVLFVADMDELNLPVSVKRLLPKLQSESGEGASVAEQSAVQSAL